MGSQASEGQGALGWGWADQHEPHGLSLPLLLAVVVGLSGSCQGCASHGFIPPSSQSPARTTFWGGPVPCQHRFGSVLSLRASHGHLHRVWTAQPWGGGMCIKTTKWAALPAVVQ